LLALDGKTAATRRTVCTGKKAMFQTTLFASRPWGKRLRAGLLAGVVLAAGGCAAQYHDYEGCVVPCGYTASPPLPFELYDPSCCRDAGARYCFPVDEAPRMKTAPAAAPSPEKSFEPASPAAENPSKKPHAPKIPSP